MSLRSTARPLTTPHMLALALVPWLLARCTADTPATGMPDETTTEPLGTTQPELPTTSGEPTTSSTGQTPPATADTGAEDSTGSSSSGELESGCGDGILAEDEACDEGIDGNSLTGSCLPGCMLATCGDGFVQDGVDECDMGEANSFEYGGCNAQTCKFNSRCGDGDIDPPHELCDPGDPSGEIECDNACRFAGRVVFLSSTEYSGNLGGLAGADKLCRELAKSFDVTGAASYRAWLSDAESSPLQRFDHGPEFVGVPYVLRSGLQIAADFDDLVLNGPAVGISLTDTDENLTDQLVWTNTGVDGDVFSATIHCENWGSASFADSARIGLNRVADPELEQWKLLGHWTSHSAGACSTARRLYCFEN